MRREVDAVRFRILATCNAASAREMLPATARIGLRIMVCDRCAYKGSVRARSYTRERTEGLTLEVGGWRSNGERHRGVDQVGPVAEEGGLADWAVGPRKA